MPGSVTARQQERAYTSPIWYAPASQDLNLEVFVLHLPDNISWFYEDSFVNLSTR